MSGSRQLIQISCIESKEEISLNTLDGEEITRFIEKPNIEKAKQFIKIKNFYGIVECSCLNQTH